MASNLTGKYLTSFQRRLLQKNLHEDLPKQYRQRIEIMLMADEGKTQTEICQVVGCSAGTVRYWISMARTGQAHDWQSSPLGRPKAATDRYLERLKELVLQNPREVGYPFRRWTAHWLSKHLSKEFDLQISDRHINRLLKEMGLSTVPQLTSPQQPEEKRIAIRDLAGMDELQTEELFPLNPIKLG